MLDEESDEEMREMAEGRIKRCEESALKSWSRS